MGSRTSYQIREAFGACRGNAEQVKVTPPHGPLSVRHYVFDRNRQTVTIADRFLVFPKSKKVMDLSDVAFVVAKRGSPAGYSIEMHHRKPGAPLRVFTLTGNCGSAEGLEPMKAAIRDATGIDRWGNL